jgi:diguanylate cyclase (GGDEF)-like protein
MLNKKLMINLLIALLVASVCVGLSSLVFFKSLNLLAFDMLFHIRGPQQQASSPLVIIEITNDDIREFGRWPWPRSKIAQLCTLLNKLGAKNIMVDILFTGASNPEDDDAFVKVVRESGNIYLPYVFTTDDIDVKKAFFPIPELGKAAKGIGFVNISSDIDGRLRKIPLFTFNNGMMYEHLILRMVKDELKMSLKTITPDSIVLYNNDKTLEIPLIDVNKLLVNWMGKWGQTFTHYRYRDLMLAHEDIENRRPPNIDLTPIRNSSCFVATTAITLNDVRANPLEGSYPGVGVIATGLTNIYNKNFLTKIPAWGNILLIYLFSIIPAFHFSREKAFRIVDIFILAGLLALAPALFFFNIVIEYAMPFFAFFMNCILMAVYDGASRTAEKNKWAALATVDELTKLHNIRYFREVLKNECRIARAAPQKSFCVILIDVDHFKEINDSHGHLFGDFVLSTVAANIKTSLRVDDLIARYGGDEMIILLRCTPLDKAMLVADKICQKIRDLRLTYSEDECQATLSLGVARFDPAADNEQSIINKADQALYKAKQSGRDQVRSDGLQEAIPS